MRRGPNAFAAAIENMGGDFVDQRDASELRLTTDLRLNFFKVLMR